MLKDLYPSGTYEAITVMEHIIQERGIQMEVKTPNKAYDLSNDSIQLRLAYEVITLTKYITKVSITYGSSMSIEAALRANENNKLIMTSGSRYAAILTPVSEPECQITIFKLS